MLRLPKAARIPAQRPEEPAPSTVSRGCAGGDVTLGRGHRWLALGPGLLSISQLLALTLCFGLLLPVVTGQTPASPPHALRSSSGQFVVSFQEGRRTSPAAGLTALEPGTLLLTCERVRQALVAELQQADPWQGWIYVVINPALTNNHPPVIGAQLFTQGWQYRMDLPPAIEAQKLVRGLVQVLLMEAANRSLPARSAEIPLWLSEGLTQQLLHSALVDLVIEPPAPGDQRVPTRRMTWQRLRPDPLEPSRTRLRTHAALSFRRMAEIGGDQVAEETWMTFQASAHVFLGYLMQLPQARPALDTLLRQLPYHLNWQTAFFQVFAPVFPRLIDVEKWWSVVLVDFTGLDPMNAWSREVALQKLHDALNPPVLVADSRDRLPRRHRIAVQQILSEWESVGQRLLLQNVVNELLTLRVKMPPELGELSEAYRMAIANYLERRKDLSGARARIGLPDTGSDRLVRTTIQTLNDLDQRRAAERGLRAPVQGAAPATGAGSNSRAARSVAPSAPPSTAN